MLRILWILVVLAVVGCTGGDGAGERAAAPGEPASRLTDPKMELVFHVESSLSGCSTVDGIQCSGVVTSMSAGAERKVFVVASGITDLSILEFHVDTEMGDGELSWTWCEPGPSMVTSTGANVPDDGGWAYVLYESNPAEGQGSDETVVIGYFTVPSGENGYLGASDCDYYGNQSGDWSVCSAGLGRAVIGSSFSTPIDSCGDCD